MEFTKFKQIPALLVLLDFSKAFDKVSYKCLYKTLQFFGYPNYLVEWTKIMYDNFAVKIQNNGKFSSQIKIQRGVHQGGNCSANYFLLIAELLAIQIRRNDQIRAICVENCDNKIGQYADDTGIYTLYDEESFNQLLNTLETFEKISGLEINYEKTNVYRVGSIRKSNAKFYSRNKLIWTNDSVKILGITIDHDMEKCMSKNYDSLIDKAESIMNAWAHRNLSLIGRIQVVNTLVLSLFVYRLLVLPNLSDDHVKKLNDAIKKYLWSKARAKISNDMLEQTKENGGLGLTNIVIKEKALKATWVQKLESDTGLRETAYENLSPTLRDCIWICNLHEKDVNIVMNNKGDARNSFWRDVFKAWCSYNYDNEKSEKDTFLWFNSEIRINDKPFLWEKYYKEGLCWASQLFENNVLISV